MKRNFKDKWFLLVLLVSIIIFIFCGCGEKNQVQTEEKVVEVRLGYPGGIDDYELLQKQIIPLFEEEHPNIKIKIEYQPWGQFFTKLKTQIAANEAPDLWLSDGVYIMEFAERGALKDLTELVSRDLDEKDYFALDYAKDVDGRIWGVPREIQTVGLYYNKGEFKDTGLDFPDEEWDWQSLLDAATKLTRDKNGDGKTDIYGYHSVNWVSAGWYNFIYQNNGKILDDTRTKSELNSKETIEAIDFMISLIHEHKVSPTSDVVSSVGSALFDTKKVP